MQQGATVRKKLDPRIRTLIETSVARNHRCLIVLTGEKSKDQVVLIHYLLAKATIKCRPTVLWCYKSELGFSSNRKKRMRHLQRNLQAYRHTASNTSDPFELFVISTDIRWCYYSESHKILGQTFGMLVLQDFESLSPNLLARTIETVQGGGVIVIVMPEDIQGAMKSTSIDHLTCQAEREVLPRFNKRLILSVRSCRDAALVINDKLDIVWASQNISNVVGDSIEEIKLPFDNEDKVANLCKTSDQLNAYKEIVKNLAKQKQYIAISASRGRGKSACMGLSIANMLGKLNQCFVTAPSIGNVAEVFKFAIEGLKLRKFEQGKDFSVEKLKTDEGEFVSGLELLYNGRKHRVEFTEASQILTDTRISVSSVLFIDEAAAISVQTIKRLAKICHRVIFSSTTDGYEGTGRILALHFYESLRQLHSEEDSLKQIHYSNYLIKNKLTLNDPIRYAEMDPIEKWLTNLLCLRCEPVSLDKELLPNPDLCELYAIDRDMLFSNHKICEKILRQINAILTASHYRNTPNDLQLLSDAPAHCLFALMSKGERSKIMCVVHAVLEGRFDDENAQEASGDMVPWTISQQFPESYGFSQRSGLRIVRIATHPQIQNLGYGTRAVSLLKDHFLKENEIEDKSQVKRSLFVNLTDRISYNRHFNSNAIAHPSNVDYLSVSFGLDEPLFKFWSKLDFVPVYLRQTQSPLTGNHSCMMLTANEKFRQFNLDFVQRCARLLHTQEIRRLPAKTMFILMNCSNNQATNITLSDGQLRRLKKCASGNSELSYCLDVLSYLICEQWIALVNVVKMPVELLILLGIAGQAKSFQELSEEIDVKSEKIIVKCIDAIKRICNFMDGKNM